VTVTAEAGSN